MVKGTRSLKSVQTQTRMASLQFGKPLLIFFFAFLFYSASFTWLQIELQQRHLAYCRSSSVSSARSPVFILITRCQRAQIHWDVPDRDLNFERPCWTESVTLLSQGHCYLWNTIFLIPQEEACVKIKFLVTWASTPLTSWQKSFDESKFLYESLATTFRKLENVLKFLPIWLNIQSAVFHLYSQAIYLVLELTKVCIDTSTSLWSCA